MADRAVLQHSPLLQDILKCICLAASIGRVYFNVTTGVYVQVKGKLYLCLTKHDAVKTYGGVDVETHVFLTSALVVNRGFTSNLLYAGFLFGLFFYHENVGDMFSRSAG
jgi:hypothetical protein